MKDDEVSHVYINNMQRDGLRAPEANEMLERTPSSLLRMGAWAVLILIALLFGIGILVRYPDTLEGAATITTSPLPIKLRSQQAGRISALFVADNGVAQKNTPVAELENPIGYANIVRLKDLIDSVNRYLLQHNMAAMGALTTHPMQYLGDAQPYYNQLLQQVNTMMLLHREQLYSKRTANLQAQMERQQSIARIANEQKKLIEEELRQADERFKANEKLYNDKVISKQEYYDEAAKLRQKRLQLEQQNAAIMQNNVNAGESNKQMLEIQYEREEKERGYITGIQEAIRNLNSYIQGWEQRYLVLAPYTGTIQYLRPLQVNEQAAAGEELFAIVPNEHKYMALVMVPAAGIGKVQVGQKVHLLVDNFPYNEFGFLEGTISKRSLLPDPNTRNANGTAAPAMYRVYVKLRDTLETNFRKEIAFSPEMTANARIITKDRNLLQRLVAGVARAER